MKRDINEFMPEVHPVVMLVRNALALTKKAVASVLAQDLPVQLHIVDNDSSDGTAEWLASGDPPGIMWHTFKPPLGVSSGWNFALTDLFRRFEHVLVVNNDVVLRPDTYRELLADGGPFVTAVSVDDIARIEGDWWKCQRPHPDFSAFLIRREVWEKVGGFDESMVLYASDNDFHVRMHKAGIEAYTIGIPFYHVASGTLKTAREDEYWRIQQQADRDRERFQAKWGCKVGSAEYYQGLFGHGAPDEKENKA